MDNWPHKYVTVSHVATDFPRFPPWENSLDEPGFRASSAVVGIDGGHRGPSGGSDARVVAGDWHVSVACGIGYGYAAGRRRRQHRHVDVAIGRQFPRQVCRHLYGFRR